MFKWIKNLFTRKSVVTTTPPAVPTKPTLCVIDDDRFVFVMMQKYFENYDVQWRYRLPESNGEIEELKRFDVLIVDCQGIGSKLCHDGQQFLSKYYDRPMTQKVIYHSGLEPDQVFETILEEKGMRWYTKGHDPMGLVNLVQNYSVVHPHIRIRPPVNYAKFREKKMEKLRRRRRRGLGGFTTIELLIVAGVILTIMTLLLKGCNRQIVDFDWNFKKAVVRDGFGNLSGTVNIKSWRDYDQSDMVQITTDKGQVILTHSANIILLGGK